MPVVITDFVSVKIIQGNYAPFLVKLGEEFISVILKLKSYTLISTSHSSNNAVGEEGCCRCESTFHFLTASENPVLPNGRVCGWQITIELYLKRFRFLSDFLFLLHIHINSCVFV